MAFEEYLKYGAAFEEKPTGLDLDLDERPNASA